MSTIEWPALTPATRRPKRVFAILFVLFAAAPVRLWFSFLGFRTLTTLDIGLWVLAAGGLLWVGITRKLRVGHRGVFVALCVPACAALISFAWTADPLSTVKMTLYSLTAVVGYLVVTGLCRQAPSRLIADSMGLFVVVSLVLALLYWTRIPLVWSVFGFSHTGPTELGLDSWTDAAAFARLDSPFLGRSNDFAAVLAVYVPFMFGVSRATRKARYAVIAFLATLGVVLTFSRGVILSMCVVITFVLARRLSLRKLGATVVAVIALLMAGMWFSARVEQSGIDIIRARLDDFGGVEARFDRFRSAIQVIEQSPILGQGGGRYLGKGVDDVDSAFHNTYLEQWASYGLLLGSLVILALASLAWSFFRWARRPGPVKTVAWAVGSSVLLFMFICTNQTANEAAIPGLMFRIFVGGATGYLLALQREQDRIKQQCVRL